MVTLVLALPKRPRKQVAMAKTNRFPPKKSWCNFEVLLVFSLLIDIRLSREEREAAYNKARERIFGKEEKTGDITPGKSMAFAMILVLTNNLLQRPKKRMRCLAPAQSRQRTEQVKIRELSHPSSVETIPKASMSDPSTPHSSLNPKVQHGLQLSSLLQWLLRLLMALPKTTIQIRCKPNSLHQRRSTILEYP